MFSYLYTKTTQAQQQVVNEISKAMKGGDIETLGTLLGEELVLTLKDEENLVTNKEATDLLSDFFGEATPASFSIKHQGNSKDGSHFAIGSLKINGENLRTYFVVNGGKVSELCIEED